MLSFPTTALFITAAAALTLYLLARLSTLIPHSQTLPAGTQPFLGWGLAAAAFTLYGTLTPFSFTYAFAALAIAALAAPHISKITPAYLPTCLPAYLLFIPFLLPFLGTQVALWDDFAHRLPNTLYLWDFARFPHTDLPPPSGNMPAYPYAGNFLGHAVNLIVGHYAETAQALSHVLLLLCTAVFFSATIAPKLRQHSATTAAATGLLLVALNPIFQPPLIASAYNDATLGITIMLAAYVGLLTLTNPNLKYTFAALLTLCILLKDTGLVPAGLIGLSISILAFKQTQKLSPVISTFGPAALASLALFLTWKFYTTTHLPTPFTIQPMAHWNWAQLPTMATSLWTNLLEKPQTFIPILLLTILHLKQTFQRPNIQTFSSTLTTLSLTTWYIYAFFLFIMYLAAFSPLEGANLASLDRYLQHTNWLVWFALIQHVAPTASTWFTRQTQRVQTTTHRILIAATILLPIAFQNQLMIRTNPSVTALQNFIQQLKLQAIPKGSKLVILDPAGSGYAAQIITYSLGHHAQVLRQINMYSPQEQLQLAEYMTQGKGTHVLVLSTNPQTIQVFGGSLPQRLPQLYQCSPPGTLTCTGLLQ